MKMSGPPGPKLHRSAEVCEARVERVGFGEGVDAVTQAGKVCVGVGR